MERMESMEPISVYYTTDYPEIHPDSAYGSTETTDCQAKTPPVPVYDEELVHKTILVGDSGVGKTSLLVQFDQGKFIPGSFSATAWLTEIHEYAQSDVVIMLLGNKADMSSDRAIKRDEGERLAREYSVPFMETSAKTGVNVELAFTAVAKELKHRAVQHPNEPKFQIHEYIEAKKEKLCVLEKGSSGYGFHLHGEKGKTGQFIRLVESDTPAAVAGLLAGDRLVFVNGESVEGESHQQVVARIRATVGALELIVVDAETAELLTKHNLQCRKEFVTEGIPLPGGDSDSDRVDAQSNGTPREGTPASQSENGDASSERSERSERLSVSSSTKEELGGLRPRLCHLKKGSSGYGFNLHSEKSKPGQFIRAVDEDSPAQRSGLKPQDKIVQAEAAERKPKVSVSSSASSASSDASLPAATSCCPPAQVEKAPEPGADSLGLSMSLAQAREKARQKRAAKKAPSMDWSKRNELFSNL
eukprot:superscaffoldBa00000313_g3709